MQAAAVEVLGGLGIEVECLLSALGDADELQEAGTVQKPYIVLSPAL